jgi:magnesium-transporting ATPase (P-type)
VKRWFDYYMALIRGSVIITGGLAVSLFRYRNDRNLCKLSYSSGNVDALRDGAPESIPEKGLVPGDVVVVRPGITYCDMVLVSSHGVLVDRSHERVNPSCEIGCLAIAPRNTTR